MKHHGGVVKAPRPPVRSGRSASERLPANTPTTSSTPPTTRSNVGFWNQYQAFLNTSNDPADDPAQGPTSGSQGEDGEMPRLAESPIRSQLSKESTTGRGSGEGSDEGPTLESMWLALWCSGALNGHSLFLWVKSYGLLYCIASKIIWVVCRFGSPWVNCLVSLWKL